MGREIRRVPKDWQHPMQDCPHSPWNGGCSISKLNSGKCYCPIYDEDFDTALEEWVSGYELWKNGKHEDQENGYDGSYWDHYGKPPRPDLYREKWKEEPLCYQMYETVSEGTPVSPVFETKAELVEYLVRHGDYWDQGRGDGGWDRKSAEGFVDREWVMSGMIMPDSTILASRDLGNLDKHSMLR